MKDFNINKLYLLLAFLALTVLYLAVVPPDWPFMLRGLCLMGLVAAFTLAYEPLLRNIEQATGSLSGNEELFFFSAFIDLNKKIHTFLQADDVLTLVNDTLKERIRVRKSIFLLNSGFILPGEDEDVSARRPRESQHLLRPWPHPNRRYGFLERNFLEEVRKKGQVFSVHDANMILRRAFEETNTSLAVPIIQNRRILCIILIGRLDNARRYSEFEYQMFTYLANQLSIVLDRIRVYEQIMQKTAMDHAEKMQVMQSLSANIAHEMRTPLSGIRASITGIETYLPALIEAHEHARRQEPDRFGPIRDSHLSTLRVTPERITLMIDQANAVIDMLLMNLRENSLDRKQLRTCDAAAAIEQALDRYPFKTGEREKVRVELADNFSFLGVETLFVYIIFNLLKNALYSIRSAQKGEILIRLERGADFNRVLFQDTGMGIDPEIRERVFEGFFTTKSEGTGAGLAFCRRTVMSFGGNIDCDSEPGEYAEFRISLPVLNESRAG